MAERQETSVMASIQDILRDAQSREEQEKLEADRRVREEEQRRLDEIRRRQEQEQDRLRAEEEERGRKVFEEQRRQAELQAVQDAAMARARMEAESHARLAELTSRQEHERQLHALSHDKSKKGLQMGLAALGVLLLALAVGGGVWISNAIGEANAAKAAVRELQAKTEEAEADKRRLMSELANAPDKATAAEVQRKLDEANQRLTDLKNNQAAGPKRAAAAGPAKPNPANNTPKPACTCQAGDPLCSCL
jgi:hypothetical protein